ncbi:MAG: DUF7144 family membrane protein [Acidimicrobiales bacterium]
MTSTQRSTGAGWILYCALMLMLAGLKLVLDGLWALDRSDTINEDLLYESDLGTWGWIWLIAGIVVVAAAMAILSRSAWAWWVGIVGSCLAIIANFFWLFTEPVSSLIGILLASLVLYGLLVHVEPESR